MASELVQSQENKFSPSEVHTEDAGAKTLANTFAQIADRSMSKSISYADEASKTNLLQTNSMLKDIEANSKLEMLRSPGHAQAIAKNAEETATKLKSGASLNRADRLNLDLATKDTIRSLSYTAQVKSIQITNQNAKYATLSAFNSTVGTIEGNLFTNPQLAESMIEAQYTSLAGQVKSGILTPVEAANLHKILEKKVELAEHLIVGMKDGVLDASDANTYHAASTISTPMSNAHLPISHDTQFHSEHYLGALTEKDIKSELAQGGSISTAKLAGIKNIHKLDHIINYGAGTYRASGDLGAVKSWPELRSRLDILTKTNNRSTFQEGYHDRLKNFFAQIDTPGGYQKYIDSTPPGARAAIEFSDRNTVIDSSSGFGTPEQIAQNKSSEHVDSLNQWVRDRNAIGIGADFPDDVRQPIPLQYLKPVQDGFSRGGDVNSAINNIRLFDKENRMYMMNHFKENPRKQLTVYAIGNLSGIADQGFLTRLMRSQQAGALGENLEKNSSQEKLLQFNQGDRLHSNGKLTAQITSQMPEIYTYLDNQSNGQLYASGQTDMALRYIKQAASDNHDYNYLHFDDYVSEFKTNMDRAYGITSGFNYVRSVHDVPLEEGQMQVLASHGINDVRQKLLEYMSPREVENYLSLSPPIMVTSPGGRVVVVDSAGQVIPDKNGQPAYSHLFTENVWRHAEQDLKAEVPSEYMKGGFSNLFPILRGKTPAGFYRDKPEFIIRPTTEGNIDIRDTSHLKPIVFTSLGKSVLIPTVINGAALNKKEAIQYYKQSDKHLGVFKKKEDANKYNEQLHQRHGWPYDKKPGENQ